MKNLLLKYEKELKELNQWKNKLRNEYCKTQRKETKHDFDMVLVKINTIEKILIDIRKEVKNEG